MGRKRNKSSPGDKPFHKKIKSKPFKVPIEYLDQVTDTEGEISDYFDAKSESESSPPPTPTRTSQVNNTTQEKEMTSKSGPARFSQEDINNLCDRLGPMLTNAIKETIKKDIVKEIKTELSRLVDKQTEKLKADVSSLKSENETLKETIRQMKLEHDDLAQYGRRANLDISGIPGDTGTPDEDVTSKVIAKANEASINLKLTDIDRCHRKGKPKPGANRKVIVRFSNSAARDRVYRLRKSFGDNIYVQENLTQHRELMSFEARKLKRDSLVSKTWVSGCKIYVELLDKSKKLIRDDKDIEEIRRPAMS